MRNGDLYNDPILSSSPPQYTNGLGSMISNPDPKFFLSSSISTIDGRRCMMVLRVLMGEADEELETYESHLSDSTDPFELDLERRKEDRMLEKDSE